MNSFMMKEKYASFVGHKVTNECLGSFSEVKKAPIYMNRLPFWRNFKSCSDIYFTKSKREQYIAKANSTSYTYKEMIVSILSNCIIDSTV